MKSSIRNGTSGSRAALAALVLAGALVLGGCDSQGDVTGEEIAALTKEVKETKRLNQQLVERLDRLERTLDGHTEDIDLLSRQRVAQELQSIEVAETAADGDSVGAATASAMGGGVDLAQMLETEDGRAAVEKAMAAVQEKRDEERRARWVDSMVDRFAEEANLSTAQAEDVRRIAADSFKKIGDLWSGMRSANTSEERAMMREEAMVKMEEIRQSANDEVKAVLSPDQFAIYEEQMSRMRGGGRRGGR